ncbi:uridine kinase [Terrabacter aerolatus]|uniref:Uridine kinase n=1 Tax=Terrabacter aerolatus TaxID=422442 RepID=A0A512CXJ4_9MICO|nr:uridine kinase [Terrabacter aerolatus]GEO28948.1 uridine kinase [Terrabacter aerolatus]
MRAPVRSTERYAVLRDLADRVVALRPGERVAVAVDGFDGAGKTVLADQLAEVIGGVAPARDVLRVSIDGFHRPREQRVARGRGPETFYEDSYDYDAFRRAVVEPFRRGEPVTPAVNDVDADAPVHPDPVAVGTDTVLLVDGIFLQRPELADVWDAAVWVDVPFAVSVPRGNARFGDGHDPDPEAEPNRRYVDGQRLYLAAVDPRSHATWVLDNTDLERPVLHAAG